MKFLHSGHGVPPVIFAMTHFATCSALPFFEAASPDELNPADAIAEYTFSKDSDDDAGAADGVSEPASVRRKSVVTTPILNATISMLRTILRLTDHLPVEVAASIVLIIS